MRKNTSREGFTLVELSLAMVFIAMLSLSIVLIITNTISSYRRGVTLTQVNSTGSEIIDDIRVAIQNSSADPLEEMCSTYYQNVKAGDGGKDAKEKCAKGNFPAQNFVNIVKTGTVKIKDEVLNNVPLFGAFCTGSYSYIWNSGYFYMDEAEVSYDGKKLTKSEDSSFISAAEKTYFDTANQWKGTARVWYKNSQGKGVDVAGFRLLKIQDENRKICVAKSKGGHADQYDPFGEKNDMATNVFDITYDDPVTEDPAEVLSNNEFNGLALYSFTVDRPAENDTSTNLFYSISFILGTTQGGPNIKASGKSCMMPEDLETADLDYCAINKFSFAVQASGE